MTTTERILKVSGCEKRNLDSRRRAGGATQQPFEEILEALAMVRAHKTMSYGDANVQPHAFTYRNLYALFHDLERKFKRLEKQIWNEDPKYAGHEDLLESLTDLAVYCAIGIQVLEATSAEAPREPHSA